MHPVGHQKEAAAEYRAALAFEKRIPEAVSALERLLAQDPEYAEAWVRLGILRFLRRDLGSAREALERARALAPDDPGALRRLGASPSPPGMPEGRQATLADRAERPPCVYNGPANI